MVAGYVDKIKLEPWSQADWDLFPNAVKVQIVKKASSNFGHVLDVEPGDATPAEAPGWAARRRQVGAIPTIYCNLSTWPAVQQAFRDQGVAQPLYWIAKYDGVKNFPTLNGITAIAKQYHGNDPNNYDLSYVADYWPGVDGGSMALDLSDKNFIIDCLGHSAAGRTGQNGENNLAGWWYNDRFEGNLNFAQVFFGMRDKVNALTTAITSLTNLVIQDAANDVTAQQVAEALQGLIVSEVVPAVHDALSDASVEVDNAAIANAVADTLRSRLLD